MGEHIISMVVIFPKMSSEADALVFYQELKSVLIGQSSLTIAGYFCGKCYDSAGLAGHYLGFTFFTFHMSVNK